MKRVIILMLAVILTILSTIPAYAVRREYSEETKRLMREAGLQVDELEWEEINRRQQEYRKRKQNRTSSNDELHIKGNKNGSVTVTDTADELHIYSNEYANQSNNYGAKYSYDEFHTAPKDIPANDGYGAGGFDELHINENYLQNVWHPEHRGNRIQGFDEFRYPDEM